MNSTGTRRAKGGRRALRFILPAILIVCLSTAGGQAQQEPPAAKASLRAATPDEVQRQIEFEERLVQATIPFAGLSRRLSRHIRVTLPELDILGRADTTADNWRIAQAAGQPSPFFCSGDFDGNALEDTVALLRDRTAQRLRLVSFHQVEIHANPGNFTSKGYEHYEISDWSEDPKNLPYTELSVVCNGPGEFQSPEGDITIKLRHASITLGYTLYYFDGSGWQSLVTGD
jgi:hypothetical protein